MAEPIPLHPKRPPGPLLQRYAETLLPTRHGELRCVVYRTADGLEHLAMIAGTVDDGGDVLCRVHSECLTGEVLGSLKCDCKAQLDTALDRIARDGRGVVLYLRQEGRGIGLGNKVRAYALQERGLDTVDANRMLGLPDDARAYDEAAAMLRDLGIAKVRLMTNNPSKVQGLEEHGIVVERTAHVVPATKHAEGYLEVKRARMGHQLTSLRSGEACCGGE